MCRTLRTLSGDVITVPEYYDQRDIAARLSKLTSFKDTLSMDFYTRDDGVLMFHPSMSVQLVHGEHSCRVNLRDDVPVFLCQLRSKCAQVFDHIPRPTFFRAGASGLYKVKDSEGKVLEFFLGGKQLDDVHSLSEQGVYNDSVVHVY